MLSDRNRSLVQTVRAVYRRETSPEILARIGNHNWDHIRRVAKHVCTICDAGVPPALTELAAAAALVHDLGYLDDPTTSHWRSSISRAKPFLRSAGYSQREIDAIASMVATHHDRNHLGKHLGQRIVYVADKCDLLGLDGCARILLSERRTGLDRDLFIDELRETLQERVTTDLLIVGVGEDLVTRLWKESEQFFETVRARGLDVP